MHSQYKAFQPLKQYESIPSDRSNPERTAVKAHLINQLNESYWRDRKNIQPLVDHINKRI